ncbi:glutaminase kidney isoform, mitochondrial isoform X1, partial [Tachysurus ichikawai]
NFTVSTIFKIISDVSRFALSSMDMEQKDYDSRSALHVAAAEGHVDVVRFLLEACKVNPVPKDRWGNTPLDEATHFGHHEVNLDGMLET